MRSRGEGVNAPDDGEVDVGDWVVIRPEQGGRDPNKRWLALDADAPRHEHWLWKSRQVTAGGNVHALTDCAEVVVSRLAVILGIPAADCRYATHDGDLGVISHNVAPEGFTLNTGASYLPEIEGYGRRPVGVAGHDPAGRMRRDEGYTLDAMEEVLSDVGPPPGVSACSAFGVFAGYLVLDALVGNGDRHPGNWALLESGTGRRFLAPTYDHGSALGAGMTDENRVAKSPEAFARRGKANPFTPRKQPLVDLALAAVRRAEVREWLHRVSRLEDDAVRSVLEAPSGRMSVVASTFMRRVILENRRRLCDVNAAQD